MEKLAVARAERYKQKGKLTLPGIEMIYLRNGFSYMSKQTEILEHFMSLIDANLEQPTDEYETPTEHHNNLSLCFLLRGSCLRHLNRGKEAENYLTFVANSTFQPDSCEMDRYLSPYASAEIGATYADSGDVDAAIEQYEQTLSNYSKYGLESRLHFRLHNRIEMLREGNNCGSINGVKDVTGVAQTSTSDHSDD